jgi:hypothetical protein
VPPSGIPGTGGSCPTAVPNLTVMHVTPVSGSTPETGSPGPFLEAVCANCVLQGKHAAGYYRPSWCAIRGGGSQNKKQRQRNNRFRTDRPSRKGLSQEKNNADLREPASRDRNILHAGRNPSGLETKERTDRERHRHYPPRPAHHCPQVYLPAVPYVGKHNSAPHVPVRTRQYGR